MLEGKYTLMRTDKHRYIIGRIRDWSTHIEIIIHNVLMIFETDLHSPKATFKVSTQFGGIEFSVSS